MRHFRTSIPPSRYGPCMNITGLEALLLLLWIVPVLILYFVVRLAVRHGIRDARRDPA